MLMVFAMTFLSSCKSDATAAGERRAYFEKNGIAEITFDDLVFVNNNTSDRIALGDTREDIEKILGEGSALQEGGERYDYFDVIYFEDGRAHVIVYESDRNPGEGIWKTSKGISLGSDVEGAERMYGIKFITGASKSVSDYALNFSYDENSDAFVKCTSGNPDRDSKVRIVFSTDENNKKISKIGFYTVNWR